MAYHTYDVRLGTKLKTLSPVLSCFLIMLYSVLPILYMGIAVLYNELIHLMCCVSLQGLIKEGKDSANRKRLVQEQKKKTEKGRDARRKQSGRYR